MKMIFFNFWRPTQLFLPKDNGWYQCTMKNGIVMDLYFDRLDGVPHWIDRRRQQVFDGYKVYKSGREALEYNRVYTDSLCERENVIAWRRCQRGYGWWRKKGE